MTKKELEKRNKELEKLLGLKRIKEDKSKAFSKVTTQYLKNLVKIKKIYNIPIAINTHISLHQYLSIF